MKKMKYEKTKNEKEETMTVMMNGEKVMNKKGKQREE